jgi:hypothetical protein
MQNFDNIKEKLKYRFGLSDLPNDEEVRSLLKIKSFENFYSLAESAEEIFSRIWTGRVLEQKSIVDQLIVDLQTLKRDWGL